MYESFGFAATPQAASVWLGVLLGLGFGALAQITQFCLRRAVVAGAPDRAAARGVWAMALAVAILGTQAAMLAGWIDFDGHRFLSPSVPVLAIVLGGLMFGAGAVLARGCVSRLTVLSASGNLRALVAVLVFAVIAHATLQGLLVPMRSTLGSVTLDLPGPATLAGLEGGGLVWTGLAVAGAVTVALRSGATGSVLLAAGALGALVPLGWIGTGFVLYDDFDPIPLESLSFAAPWAGSLFHAVAASLVTPGFGVGLIGGVLVGAAAAAVLRGDFEWQGYSGPEQMGQSLGGAVLMGMGAVIAGGCTVGAGLSGVATLSVSAMLALGSIIAGMALTDLAQRHAALRGASAIAAE